MSNDQARKDTAGACRQGIEFILSLENKELLRVGKDYEFTDIEEALRGIRGIYERLNLLQIEILPLEVLSSIRSVTGGVGGTLTRIKEFTPEKPEYQSRPREIVDQFKREVEQQYRESFKILAPIVSFLEVQSIGLSESAQKSKKILKDLSGTLEAAQKNGVEVEKALENARRATGEIGIREYARNFKLQSDEHKRMSLFWFFSTALLSVGTLLYAIHELHAYTNSPFDLTGNQAVQVAISRVVVFGILYFGILWSSKTYRAHRHNYVVNKHRQNALDTFEAFVSASKEDPETKNAILLEATKCIFSHQLSGYLTSEPDPSPSQQFVEIFRGINPAGGKS